MKFYLDTNIFYYRYCPFEDSKYVDKIFEENRDNFQMITNEIMITEMFRAFKKQVNLEVIDLHSANVALDFFLADIEELVRDRFLFLIPISKTHIIKSRPLIFKQNLYAMDALHAITAIDTKCAGFITMDSDFKVSLGDIRIIYPNKNDFHQIIEELK